MRRIIKRTAIVVSLILPLPTVGAEYPSYVDGSKPFIEIEDVNRQSEAWGTCSVIYEISATIAAESKPAQARLYKDLSNGASMAVAMTHVMNGFTADISPERFDALWAYSKSLISSIPETKKNIIFADAEGIEADEFLGKIVATIEVCMENLESQQDYIDDWRELAKSGLLTHPGGAGAE